MKTIYMFDCPNGENSPNYLRRVRTGGGGFVDAVNTPVEIEEGDVLLKLKDSPWFAHFRDKPEQDVAEAKTETAPTDPPLVELETGGDPPPPPTGDEQPPATGTEPQD